MGYKQKRKDDAQIAERSGNLYDRRYPVFDLLLRYYQISIAEYLHPLELVAHVPLTV